MSVKGKGSTEDPWVWKTGLKGQVKARHEGGFQSSGTHPWNIHRKGKRRLEVEAL